MITLHLGVNDIPYTTPGAQPPRRRVAKAGKRATAKPRGKPPVDQLRAFLGLPAHAMPTTGDVATILEAKYHVMEHFFTLHEADIGDALVRSLKNAVDTIMMGGPATLNPFGGAESLIETRFKQFLSNRELDGLGYPGIPTKAALQGRTSRKKSRKSEGPRPSFIDTGLFVANFRAWMDAR